MSRRRARAACGLSCLLATLGGAGHAVAQIDESALLEELERLSPVYDEAVRRADVADSLETLEEYSALTFEVDTTAVGPFFLITRGDQTNDLVPTARAAWAIYDAYLDDRPTALDGIHLWLQVADRRARRVPLAADGGTNLRSLHSQRERVRRFAEQLGRQLGEALPAEHQRLMGILRLHGARDERLSFVYRELVVSNDRVAGSCFEGDLDDCRRGLGLQDEATWWESWYGPERLRLRIQPRVTATLRGAGERAETASACWEAESADACLAFASTWMEAESYPPFSFGARESFVEYALRSGGEGTYQDLMAVEAGTAIERLAEAAGTSVDELTAGWRDEVLANRPDVMEGTARTRWATLSWVLVLLAFSMRSTRWRLG
jgi:hypothetical protein